MWASSKTEIGSGRSRQRNLRLELWSVCSNKDCKFKWRSVQPPECDGGFNANIARPMRISTAAIALSSVLTNLRTDGKALVVSHISPRRTGSRSITTGYFLSPKSRSDTSCLPAHAGQSEYCSSDLRAIGLEVPWDSRRAISSERSSKKLLQMKPPLRFSAVSRSASVKLSRISISRFAYLS